MAVGMDFDVSGRRCFLLGIGGCGVSGLARMLRARGAIVSGADAWRSETTEALQAEGVPVALDQPEPTPLPEACDLVIASAAIPADDPRLIEARRRGIETLAYAEALGRCMARRTGVAIAGTHGKSTTAAMLAVALCEAGLDPTAVIGAECAQLGMRDEQWVASHGSQSSATNRLRLDRGSLTDASEPRHPTTGFRLGAERIPRGPLAGEPGVLIAEACEFNRSFHNLSPRIASIGSVEADHLDVYGSLDAVVEAFAQFAQRLPPAERGGKLLIGHDGAHRREVTAKARCAVETIGFSPGADWRVSFDRQARRIGLEKDGRELSDWTAPMPGEHNALNSAIAAALAITLGAEPDAVARALGAFRGVERRTQLLAERSLRDGGTALVYDDYGHHPTEIDATLRALREHTGVDQRGGRLICVFQPHQHSRTRFLLEEFAQSFSQADVVIVPHIYFVRDSEIERTKVSAADLVDRLRAGGAQAMHVYPFEAIVEQLETIARGGDVIVVMGAGPVWKVARAFAFAAPREVSA